MKVNSDHAPNQFTESREKLFFNFNIVESEKTDEQGLIRTVFDYESVEVKDKSRNSLIKAVIKNTYSLEDEIALINNNDVVEYAAYQDFRTDVKAMIDAGLV